VKGQRHKNALPYVVERVWEQHGSGQTDVDADAAKDSCEEIWTWACACFDVQEYGSADEYEDGHDHSRRCFNVLPGRDLEDGGGGVMYSSRQVGEEDAERDPCPS